MHAQVEDLIAAAIRQATGADEGKEADGRPNGLTASEIAAIAGQTRHDLLSADDAQWAAGGEPTELAAAPTRR